jgi:hypothetical protein
MTEMNYIVRNAGPGSLVIIDELCNETAADQGSAICWSICEALMMTEAWVMIATHTPLITKLQDLYFNVTKSVLISLPRSCLLFIQFGNCFFSIFPFISISLAGNPNYSPRSLLSHPQLVRSRVSMKTGGLQLPHGSPRRRARRWAI